jgi:hypothetical protein
VYMEMLVILKLRCNRIDPQLSGVAARFFIYIFVFVTSLGPIFDFGHTIIRFRFM